MYHNTNKLGWATEINRGGNWNQKFISITPGGEWKRYTGIKLIYKRARFPNWNRSSVQKLRLMEDLQWEGKVFSCVCVCDSVPPTPMMKGFLVTACIRIVKSAAVFSVWREDRMFLDILCINWVPFLSKDCYFQCVCLSVFVSGRQATLHFSNTHI